MITGPEIYSKDKLGRIRSWQYIVLDDTYSMRTGIVGADSSYVTSKPKKVVAKSKASPEEQALFQAEAAMVKQLRIDYHLTIEDARKYGAKVFLPQLATPYDDVPEPTRGFSQRKYDGIRSSVYAHRMTGALGAFSREGKEQATVPFIVEELRPFIKGDFAFDGELYNHAHAKDFNKIVSLVRKTHVSADQIEILKASIKFYIYDVYVPGLSFADRQTVLKDAFARGNFRYCHLVETDEFNTGEERDKLYEQYLTEDYEGQIIRLHDGVYEMGTRPKHTIKRKEFTTEEFPIIRLEEGEGNWFGAIARVVIQLPNGNECETGIRGDFATRAKMLKEKDEYVGGTATVRFLNWTPDGMLRGGVTIDAVQGERED